MPGLIPERFIDELLARIDIVDVVQPRVPLKRAGREFMACCPFHDERTPSFTVSPAKQFYHCFGCGAHGSAIKFLMDYDRLEFPDAVEELAQSIGLAVPHDGGAQRPREDHTDMYALLDAAASFYQDALPANAAAKAYCRKRGLDAETLRNFRIGWAPGGWDALKRALGTSAARTKMLVEAGMLSAGEGGKQYDRFRERLMFPILDRRGRVIAFGGRIITSTVASRGPPARDGQQAGAATPASPGSAPAKYLNSPETPLFHKGRELFALWQVREANRKLERLIVVEGYMDVVALHQAGITQAVATLGTSTTHEHAELLFRAAPDVYFCFDGDKAGRSAAWRALESVLPRMRDGRQAFFLFLPEGEDPDTLVRKEGKEGFEARLGGATPMIEYFYRELGRDANTATPDGRARLAEHAKPLLARLPDGAFRDLMLAELERRTGVRAATVLSAPPLARGAPAPELATRSLVSRTIAMLLAEPDLAQDAAAPLPFAELDLPGIPLLVELVEAARAHPGISTVVLLQRFADRPESAALQKLALAEFPGEPEMLRVTFVDALRKLSAQYPQQRLDALIHKQRQATLDDAEKNELRELLARKGKGAR